MNFPMNMKKILVVLVLGCLLLPPVHANPVPVSERDGTLAVDDGTPVKLQYENVTYVIDEAHRANVTAIYHLKNPTRNRINLTIFLPFSEQVPEDLALWQDNAPLPYNRTEYPAPFHPSAACTCSISARATSQIRATYSLWIAEVSHQVVMHRYACRYLAETGRYWNGSIETARFTFKVAKDLYSFGLSGFNLSETPRYMMARATYGNWTPDGNVQAIWYNVNAYGRALLVVIPVGIIVGVVVVARALRKKRE